MRTRSKVAIKIMIIVVLTVGTVLGCFGYWKAGERERQLEREKKEAYLLSIKEKLHKDIAENQKYNLDDGSVIYFEPENKFVWYMDDTDHEKYYYSGTYAVYHGEDAEDYIFNEATNHDMTEEELQKYYANAATNDLYEKENLTCLVLHNELAVFDGKEQFSETHDTNYIGFYANGYYWAINLDNRVVLEFCQPELLGL